MMNLLKKMAVLSLVVLALGGCTQSSTDATVVEMGNEEVDPDKLKDGGEADVTLAREDNILVFDDETEDTSLYDWDQVRDQAEALFTDKSVFPQSVKMDFTADESKMSVELTWVLLNGTSKEDAEEYATMLVRQFNDIVAVQSTDLENASDDSFGGLWDQFSLSVKVGTEDGKWLVDKSYKAGEKIDLAQLETNDAGPEDESEDVPKKN